MAASTFNPLEAARELKAAGIEPEHAEAIAGTMRRAVSADRDELATRADLVALRSELRADLYRALWLQGGAIIAILAALRFLPI